jgi:hypothetical protein
MSNTQRGGYNNTSQLSPTPLTGAVPDMFPSNVAKVGGHGCAGTRSNIASAKGNYVSYQGGGVCLPELAAIGGTTGPSSGHAAVQRCGNMVRSRTLALGAGNVASGGGKKRKYRLRSRKSKSRNRRKGKSRRRRKGKSRNRRKGKSRNRRKGKSRNRSRARTFRGRRSRKQRGGYHQSLTNVPYSQGYQAAGIHLPASQSALASPVPYTAYANCPT